MRKLAFTVWTQRQPGPIFVGLLLLVGLACMDAGCGSIIGQSLTGYVLMSLLRRPFAWNRQDATRQSCPRLRAGIYVFLDLASGAIPGISETWIPEQVRAHLNAAMQNVTVMEWVSMMYGTRMLPRR